MASLLAAPLLTGCDGGSEQRSQDPRAAASTAKKVDAVEAEAPHNPVRTGPAAGDLHLRIAAGSVLRDAPSSGAAVKVLSASAVLPVKQRSGDAFLVAFPGGEGWVHAGSRVQELRIRATRLPPQEAESVDPAVVARAVKVMAAGGRDLQCGPYRLVTDVPGDDVVAICRRVAAQLDQTYRRLYGVTPVGQPREALFLFHRRRDLRAFSADNGQPLMGYAGHARGSEGYLALHWSGDGPALDSSVKTLVHEMAHLVGRRALGAPLPRWLSEGLADGLGDPATAKGLGPIEGLGGVEAAARRVLERSDLPDLSALVRLGVGEFDRGSGARDYEQSAVFVRFLMSSSGYRSGFLAYLEAIAGGGETDGGALLAHLGLDRGEAWDVLNSELRAWLDETSR